MTQLSTRYVPHLLASLLPILLPVGIHSYWGLQVKDCGPALEAPPSSGAEKDENKMREMFAAVQWRRGSLSVDTGVRLDFTIVRSYDLPKLYHHPETGLLRGSTPDRREVEWVPAASERLPVHRAIYPRGESAVMAAYLLVYDGRPIDNPYLAQLASLPAEAIRGNRPMTMFFVSARGSREDFARMEAAGREWLAAEWGKYRGACAPVRD